MNIPDSLQSYDNVMTKYPNVYNNQHGNEHPGLFTILWQCMTKYTNVYNNQHGNEHPDSLQSYDNVWQNILMYTIINIAMNIPDSLQSYDNVWQHILIYTIINIVWLLSQ
jgi:hypothetical protein